MDKLYPMVRRVRRPLMVEEPLRVAESKVERRESSANGDTTPALGPRPSTRDKTHAPGSAQTSAAK